MKKFLLADLILTLLVIAKSPAQIDTTLKEFYPLHTGDLWQYRNQYNQLVMQKVVGDTMIDNDRYFVLIHSLISSGGGITRIDSILRIQNYGDTCSVYHLNESVGAYWKICHNIVATLCRPWFMRFVFFPPEYSPVFRLKIPHP